MLIKENKLLFVDNLDIMNGTVIIPDNIEIIVSNAFDNCLNLLYLNIPSSIKIIEYNAFKGCNNLKKILLPPSIKNIFNNTFNECINLEYIYFPSSLTDATDVISNIIKCNKKVNIYIYDKFYKSDDVINVKNIRITEMLNRIYKVLIKNGHIYNFSKEDIYNMYNQNNKFKDIVNNMIYNSKKDNSNYEVEISKFDNLFVRTRFINLPSDEIFETLDLKLSKNYNVKMIKELKKIDFFKLPTLNCEKILTNIISFFGLFENDNKCYQRLNLLKNVLRHKYQFTNEEYLDMPDNIKQYFMKVSGTCFLLNNHESIPSDFKKYLKRVMEYDDIKNIRKLKNRYGKLINDYFKNNYAKNISDIYIPKKNMSVEELQIINNYIINLDVDNQMTCKNINEIFTNMKSDYNERILNFFLKNINIIISRKEYRLKFKEIVERYDEIKYYYLAMGNDNFSYHDAYRYLCETVFSNIKKGNYEFEQMVKKAGVTRQTIFEKYQELYNIIKNNNVSSIPRVKEMINIIINNNNYTVLGEILRKDDPFSLLVGELSYTDCCQRLDDNGSSCLMHAIDEGRIFCTYLIEGNNKILLSQSWMWRNGNVVCFDNIEGTSYMKKNILYSKLVANIYKYISHKIINSASKENDKIDVIMIGSDNNDLEVIDKYFGEKKENNVWPKKYYDYTDSSYVYYVYGSEELVNTDYPVTKKYYDERIISHEKGTSITSKTIEKIGKINYKYSNINFGIELSKLLDIPINELSVIYGEDWYIIYTVIDNKLSLLDYKVKEIYDKYILMNQQKEILNVCKSFIQRYDTLDNKVYKK